MRYLINNARGLFRAQGQLLVLISVMFLIYFGQAIFGDAWYKDLMAVPGEIMRSWSHLREGKANAGDWMEFTTLLTCVFLHADFNHVLYNMIFLWIFAALVAELLGWRWMLIVFVTTAVAGSLCHTLLNREHFIPMLGASGAVMGFEGFYLGLAVRYRLPDPHVWPMARPVSPGQLAALAVIGVFFDYQALTMHEVSRVAHGAHAGGFTMGLFLAALLAPRPRPSSGRFHW